VKQRAHVETKAPTLRAKFACAGSADAAESADLASEAGTDFLMKAVSHDVVGEWLLRLAKAKRLVFSPSVA
jgi:hypothetical protein